MTIVNANIPAALDFLADDTVVVHSSEVTEITPEDSEADESVALLAEIARLRHVNAELAAKAAAKANAIAAKAAKAEGALPSVQSYQASLLASIDDIAGALHEIGILHAADDILDTRSFVKLFGLEAVAQWKESGAKGVGKHLYKTSEVIAALNILKAAQPVKVVAPATV